MELLRRDKENNQYKRLQEDTLRKLQAYCGAVWTDFNPHDPGVTIADVLNYALYELDYQLRFAPENYLRNSKKNPWEDIGLLPPEKLFDRSPVTTGDYEELICDTFRQVKRCQMLRGEDMAYHICLDTEEEGEAARVLIEKVERLYHQYRNLGERLGTIRITPLPQKSEMPGFRPLRVLYRNPLSITKSDRMLPKQHVSVLEHFPSAYGLMEDKKEAVQLKGFLLIYDLLLARMQEQIRGTGELLKTGGVKYPSGFPSFSVPLTDQWIDKNKPASGKEKLYRERLRQKSRYLDKLDRMYGTSTRSWFTSASVEEQNRKRASFLLRWPALQRDRFRATDLLAVETTPPGVLDFMSVLLEQPGLFSLPMSDYLSRYHLRLLDDTLFFKRYKYKLEVDMIRLLNQEEMETVSYRPVRFHEQLYHELYLKIHILWHNVLYESFLIYGRNIKRYRMIPRVNGGYILLFSIPGSKQWIALGEFFEKDHLIYIANLFCQFLQSVVQNCSPVYLVEHILLYSKGESVPFPGKLTFVFPRFMKAVHPKQRIEQLIRTHIPAHLSPSFLWLRNQDMVRFEKLYFEWLYAWKKPGREGLEELSLALRNFLTGWSSSNPEY